MARPALPRRACAKFGPAIALAACAEDDTAVKSKGRAMNMRRNVLPLGCRAAMVFADNMTALRCSAIIGVFAGVVFVVGIMTTQWEEGK